ncbi:MAG: hypothetical protein ACTSVZ_08935 [Promethearchaeota archaeon]
MPLVPLWFRRFIQFSGILEILIAIAFFFVELIPETQGLDFISTFSFPLFYLFTAVEFLILGFLLWYSAKDLQQYRVIVYSSCVFRYLMAIPELVTAFRFPQLMLPLILGMIYDWTSASLTLFGMKKWVSEDPKGGNNENHLISRNDSEIKD